MTTRIPLAPKILRNRCRCKNCETIIESKHRHDMVHCACGNVFTDGGTSYIRRGWSGFMDVNDAIEDMTEYEECP